MVVQRQLVVETKGISSKKSEVQVPILSLSMCASLGKSIKLSVPQLRHWKVRKHGKCPPQCYIGSGEGKMCDNGLHKL